MTPLRSLGSSVEALAWHDDTALLVRDGSYDEPLESVDVVTGRRVVMVRFRRSDASFSLQLAQALTPHARLVDVGAVDRGPMSLTLRMLLGFLALLAAATAVTAFGAVTSSSDAAARRAWRYVWCTTGSCVLVVCAAGPAILFHALTVGTDEALLDLAAACALLATMVTTRAGVWASRRTVPHHDVTASG